MNEACDRCGPAVRAAYRVERRGELYLCRNCASQQWAALSARAGLSGPLGCWRSRRKPANSRPGRSPVLPVPRQPAVPAARPAGPKRASARRGQHRGALPGYRGPRSPRPARRLIRSITVVPSAPARIPIPSQTRRASARPIPPLRPSAGGRSRSRPPAAAVADLGLRRPADDPQQQPRRRRPVPDRVRRDLTHRDNEIIRPARRPGPPAAVACACARLMTCANT
jgi:hypothetical protein